VKHARCLPKELYRSLTWDRGKKMADHRRFTLATDIQVYFCDPQHPWQRASRCPRTVRHSVRGQNARAATTYNTMKKHRKMLIA